MTGTRRLLVFCRAPQPGEVKTRLIPALGAAAAAALYRRLLEHTVTAAAAVPDTELELWCHPGANHPYLHGLAQGAGAVVRDQRGGDLGERMFHALAAGGGGVLCGSDCPGLTPDYLDGAFDALETGAGAVFGPAADGGYVLVGLRSPSPVPFAGMAWGHSRVMVETRRRLAAADLAWRELATLRDVDRPGDLEWLRRDHPEIADGG